MTEKKGQKPKEIELVGMASFHVLLAASSLLLICAARNYKIDRESVITKVLERL